MTCSDVSVDRQTCLGDGLAMGSRWSTGYPCAGSTVAVVPAVGATDSSETRG